MSKETEALALEQALEELRRQRPRYVREADARAAEADAELDRVEREVCAATGVAWPRT